MRHPCAVVASQMRYGAWDQVQPGFSEEGILADPLLAPHYEILVRIDSIEAHLAAVWAAVNVVALNHPEADRRWMTLFYEDFVRDPVSNVRTILDDWRLDINGGIEEASMRPSGTTLGSSPIKSGRALDQLSYWQRTLDKGQVHRILDTVTAIGVSIYGDAVLPCH